jgi:glyoxylase-like metal-dependent hydrolase (beta-lactamase superfamily II)
MDTQTTEKSEGGDDTVTELIEDEFTCGQVEQDVFLCRERYYKSFNVANLYVIRGTKMDLIIDTGVGLWDFGAFLRAKGMIGTRPYLALATHVHFDHAGGLFQFGNIGIHALEAGALEDGNSYEACCFMSDSECAKPPSSSWRAKDYKLTAATPTRLLHDGDILDLGDRTLHVLHLPGHSRGSIGLWDESNGILFSGDTVYQGTLLDILPFSNIPDYVRSFQKLIDLAPQVKRVLPGHEDLFDGKRLKELAEEYLDKASTCYECSAMAPKAIATFLLKGRNTRESCPRCCYVSCCCHLCESTVAKQLF